LPFQVIFAFLTATEPLFHASYMKALPVPLFLSGPQLQVFEETRKIFNYELRLLTLVLPGFTGVLNGGPSGFNLIDSQISNVNKVCRVMKRGSNLKCLETHNEIINLPHAGLIIMIQDWIKRPLI
jgi:hypothetical protein